MHQEEFRSILRKYLEGRATPEEAHIIEKWYSEMGRKDAVNEEDIDPVFEKKYWSFLQSHVGRDKKVRPFIPWGSIGVAASFVIAVLVSLYLALPKKRIVADEVAGVRWEEVINSGMEAQRLVLEDGSVISLEPRSLLKYAAPFAGTERIVFLEGGAFFEIARDEERPFTVNTSQLATTVLGTSFQISAYTEDPQVTVAVKTGKVSVSPIRDSLSQALDGHELILTPNQQVVFDKEKKKLSRMLVEKPQPIPALTQGRNLRFEAEPVPKIFEAIEKVYGVDLVFDHAKFSQCTLTSVISDGDLFKRLDIICRAIGATYRIKENRIIVTGPGCDAP